VQLLQHGRLPALAMGGMICVQADVSSRSNYMWQKVKDTAAVPSPSILEQKQQCAVGACVCVCVWMGCPSLLLLTPPIILSNSPISRLSLRAIHHRTATALAIILLPNPAHRCHHLYVIKH